jgi:hypothetical protein
VGVGRAMPEFGARFRRHELGFGRGSDCVSFESTIYGVHANSIPTEALYRPAPPRMPTSSSLHPAIRMLLRPYLAVISLPPAIPRRNN